MQRKGEGIFNHRANLTSIMLDALVNNNPQNPAYTRLMNFFLHS